MSFKTKRIISILLAFLPIVFLVASIFMANTIIENDLLSIVIVVALLLIVLSIVSSFLLTRCPHCNNPIPSIALIFNSEKCPYCDKEYDDMKDEDIDA